MRGKRLLLPLVLILVLANCGIAAAATRSGAATGGLLGAVAGGIIGHQKGKGLEGAAIGAAAGLLTGGLIGADMDKRALTTNSDHITVIRVAEMGRQGVPDAVIIGEIKRTGSGYNLTSEIITYLKDNKVSDRVVDYMMSTAVASGYAGKVVVREKPAFSSLIAVGVRAYCPSQSVVWVPGYWKRYGRHGRHVWVAGYWKRQEGYSGRAWVPDRGKKNEKHRRYARVPD